MRAKATSRKTDATAPASQKFFLYSQPSPFLCGVHFTEVQTDARMTNLFYRLKKLLPVWCAAFPNSQEVTRNDDAKEWSMSFYGNTLRIENHHRKGFNADFQAEELEEGLLPALLNPFKRRFRNVSQSFELRGIHDPTSLHCRKTVTRQSHCR